MRNLRLWLCDTLEVIILKVALFVRKRLSDWTTMQDLSVQDLAKWFLSKEAMTHKKLQKLCYYAVAWGYALTGKKLVSDDEFQAWVHGPVSPSLYATYKDNGWNLINKTSKVPAFSNNLLEILEAVWLTYGDKGGNELEAISHSEKPWIQARAGLKDNESSVNPISTDVMREFYNSIKSTEY